MARYLRGFAVLAVVALTAAGCGDSGDDAGNGGDGGSDTQTSVADGGDSDDTLITLGALLDDIPGLDDDCLAIANVFAAIANASLAIGGQVDFDAGDAQALFDQAASGLPADLQGDIQVMADAMIGYFQALSDIGFDLSDPGAAPSEEQIAALLAVGESLDTAEFNAASENLSAYTEAQCDQFGG